MKRKRQSEAQEPVDHLDATETAEQTATAAQGADSDAGDVEGAAEASESTDGVDLEEQLALKESELAKVSDQLLRVVAEYENFRRRTQKEKEALYADSICDVVKAWLPVLDNLERAAEAAMEAADTEVGKNIAQGVELVRKQAAEVLQNLGVSVMDCQGKPFDPNLHNAVLHVEDEALPESTVAEVFQNGYQLGERVIRHSQVKVAN